MASSGQGKPSSVTASDTGSADAGAPATASPRSIPPHVPDHELLSKVGSGSYGEVWLARSVTGAWRAVKIVYRSSFEQDKPYEREFAGIQKFEPISRAHEGHVDILHVGRNEAAGYFYYVMELADSSKSAISNQCSVTSHPNYQLGDARRPPKTDSLDTDSLITEYSPRTLKGEIKRRGPLPVDDCVAIGLALTRALAHLHEHGLVHRDIKPSNIIFVDGSPKLADIGLVTGIDATRSFVGTDGYIPPEGPGTPQADLYSLGKVLYEMSTGRDRLDFPELPDEWRTSPERERLLEFNEVVLKACEDDLRQRYASAQQLESDLALLQRGQSVKRLRVADRRWAVFKKTTVAVTALILLSAAFVMLWHGLNRDQYSGDGPPSTNALANALCAKALLVLRGDNRAAFAEAYTNLHRAIGLDSHFTRPYVGLFELRSREITPELPPTSSEEIHSIAHRLEALAPRLGVTHCALALVSYCDLDYPKALAHARQSVRADPGYEFGHLWYGYMLAHWGRPLEGRKEIEIARKIAPSKATVYRALGHTYYAQRDFTNAIAMYRQAIGWQSHHTVAHYFIGRSYQALGDYLEAISYFEQRAILSGATETATRALWESRRLAFRETGVRGYWQEEWKLTEENSDREFYRKAVAQIHLGDTNAAFAWLNKSYESREIFPGEYQRPLEYLLFDEHWDRVRDDPRFKDLLDKIGFTMVMPKR